ncbi:hypothetical protein PVAP13_2KG516400 [Panicum virgatum]|uniref:Uncharacterized protein n=1 Tax=Panicum virgatum TaxID=38727 RepID=A0A8T0WH96_PANVG|nr:hypothetical protein PVAP13_2KG516400 [Panicum virgatum]
MGDSSVGLPRASPFVSLPLANSSHPIDVSSLRAVVRKQRDPPVIGPLPYAHRQVCRERSASIRSTGSSIQRLSATLANSQSSRNTAALAIPNHPTAPSHRAAAVAPPQYSAPSSRPRPITPPSHRPAAARFPICLRKGSRRILNGDWRQRRARGRAHLQPKEGAPAAVYQRQRCSPVRRRRRPPP